MEKPKTVKEYIANASPEGIKIMHKLRAIIKSTVPEAEERIAWNVPNYTYHGILCGFAAYTNHISFGVGSSGLSAEDRDAFKKQGYKTGKGTVQIKFDQRVPEKLIKKVILVSENINKSKD
jgi:uncharacterized protein YdhG (YjbR/CyaY superfamily)